MMERNELLDAVDKLTKPVVTRVRQAVYETEMRDDRPVTDEAGNPVRHVVGTKTTRLEREPLLTSMEAAIRGAMGTSEGTAASLKFTRGMINSEALYHFARIRSMITDWARTLKVPRTDDPVAELRRWYVAWVAEERVESKTRWHTHRMVEWATLIEETIDPWNPRPLPGPCPVDGCPQEEIGGLWFYWDPRTRERGNRPLLVEYRPAEPGERLIDWARARCRACDTRWENVRALQWDREHADTP